MIQDNFPVLLTRKPDSLVLECDLLIRYSIGSTFPHEVAKSSRNPSQIMRDDCLALSTIAIAHAFIVGLVESDENVRGLAPDERDVGSGGDDLLKHLPTGAGRKWTQLGIQVHTHKTGDA